MRFRLRFRSRSVYVPEILGRHFQGLKLSALTTTSRQFPSRVRADLQNALEALVEADAMKCLGIKASGFHEDLDFASLSAMGHDARLVAPLRFEEVDIGEDQPKRCLVNGLWLVHSEGQPIAVLLCRVRDLHGNETRMIEIAGAAGEALADYTKRIFDGLEEQVRSASTYRGKVISLEQTWAYSGRSKGISVHRLEAVNREEIILPPKLLELIDRTIVEFTQQRELLKKHGQSARRGVLLHGAPGTGKTHTIRYIASKLPNHTTLLITAEQVALLDEYFELARLMQPSILVLEDVDLIARDRERMSSPGEELLLNKLLNNMDGLKEDAEILFLLTTNRPEILESALADRPGRIDQSIEFPKPDADCRRRLLALYSAKLRVADELQQTIVARTEGVSAAFIKELVRRMLQLALGRSETAEIAVEDVGQALEDMLFSGGRLNAKLLGAGDTG